MRVKYNIMSTNESIKCVTIQNPSSYIRKTARQVVLSRCYATNFAHIWGGDSIEPPYELDNQLLTCKHDDSDYLILRGSE